ncbi:PREDICTED: uncharacterized protein LOC104777985 [Camelina sativa]|uniref:Uncharacterized protein LOC104777973 n=1 Tax=Camelina sativa TaxID=90675 RepID=A0ABM0YGP1_CAMSA|nr:PREDICTED: uncharacterized protein LOC104777973 [Camelina sativa]XP_010500633.1 PREDICTED: uncharacterized protein LOC104777985 [Camelina sativa]
MRKKKKQKLGHSLSLTQIIKKSRNNPTLLSLGPKLLVFVLIFSIWAHQWGKKVSNFTKKTEWCVLNLMIGCFKDATYVLMRVLLCKIQCPSFICFCKPSPHIYASGSLKLENAPSSQVSSSTTAVVDHDDDDDDDDDDAHVEEEEEVVDHVDDGLLTEVRGEDCALVEVKKEEEEEEGHGNGEILKSSLRKEVLDSADGGVRREKKKVQWVDLMGKELAEIREFESSEEEDTRYDGDQSCVCVIL